MLVNIVLEDSSDGLLECTRVYGNLSRYPTVRKILAEKKGRGVLSRDFSCNIQLGLLELVSEPDPQKIGKRVR